MGLSNTDLMRRISRGSDHKAEAELCRLMGPRIASRGMRHLRYCRGAEDLLQHVLITTPQSVRAGCLGEPEKLASQHSLDKRSKYGYLQD